MADKEPVAPRGRYTLTSAAALSAAPAPSSKASLTRVGDWGLSGYTEGSEGRHCAAVRYSYLLSTMGPLPLYLNILIPLSTFMRGARVDVMKKRPSGDQPKLTVQWAFPLPIFFFLFTSQKSMSPAKLPQPARTRNRPWGLQDMVLRCAAPPKLKIALHLRSKRVMTAGMRPYMTTNWRPFGDHLASEMGPSFDRGTAAASPDT
mmetsp:Transcript_23107/g.31610  ORF Transcript_23107/g.31610 Transcript_23107/m.31610 type:complete len:204 (+) Transcript_23107:816-1427(+)